MDAVLSAMLNEVIKLHDGKVSANWEKAFTAVLDAYLGKVPENFTYKGKSYTPASFAASLPIKASDYVTLTSFTHHPFYQNFVLEIPDNWAVDAYTNVTLDELEATIDNALANGYSVGWASDVSEKGFSYKNGLAIVPEKNWDDMTKGEKDSLFLHLVKQKQITQAYRQEAFDNLTTTDDHGMHITGSCTDSLGQKYYIVKNSWGSDDSDLKGYFLASASYIRYKTTNILVHKDAIPAELRKKINR
jgi:bleomycin hydrolase